MARSHRSQARQATLTRFVLLALTVMLVVAPPLAVALPRDALMGIAVRLDHAHDVLAEMLDEGPPDTASTEWPGVPVAAVQAGQDLDRPPALGTDGAPVPTRSAQLGGDAFVEVDGTRFTLDGQPFQFVGFNLFDAASTSSGYHCAWWTPYSDAQLDEALAEMHTQAGATVLRFWAFQSYTRGGTDWTGIDRVIRLAKANGMRVIPVLENGQKHCTEGGSKWLDDGSWYSNAYRQDFDYGYPLSLPAYVERIVTRYRDEPTVFGWMVMNEAETDNVVGLYDFAREMTALVKRVDTRHPVTLGTQSSGQAGTRGMEFVTLYGLPTIDFVEGHDYAQSGGDALPLPGSTAAQTLPDPLSCSNDRAIACSISQTRSLLKKPFIIGEAGVQLRASGVAGRLRGDYTAQQRAAIFEAKLRAAFANGVSGYLVWQWSTVVDQGYDILSGDPLTGVMQRLTFDLGLAR